MTEIGFIIQSGQRIPDDVIRVLDFEQDAWSWVGADVPTGLWQCEKNQPGDVRSGAVLSESWGPLTVTAVREQPAEPEPRCPECGCTSTQNTGCNDAWHTPDVLDLVRQYGDARLEAHRAFQLGAEVLSAEHRSMATEWLARIEAEVNRLRAEPVPAFTKNKGEIHVTAVLDESGQPRLFVQWPPGAADPVDAYQGQMIQRIAELEGEVQRLNAEAERVTSDLVKARDERDEARADVERWRGRVLDLLPDPSAPLVLSLPKVPEGAVALVTRNQDGDEVRFVPAPKQPGSWVMASGAPTGDWLLVEILRAFDGSVTVVMREPRTWKRTDITEDLPAVVDVEGFGRWRLHRDYDGEPMGYSQPGRGDGKPFRDLLAWGDVTEVFDDKDGTR